MKEKIHNNSFTNWHTQPYKGFDGANMELIWSKFAKSNFREAFVEFVKSWLNDYMLY